MPGDQAVHRLAFGRHRAALGAGDAFGDAGQFAQSRFFQPARPKAERADQGAMHDEVGVAADRRSEMRVAAQVEAEMAVVFMGIFGLRLRAQHDFVDQRLCRLTLDASEHAIEMFRAHALALDELDAEGREKLAERADLLRARRVMGAVDQRRMRGFQRLGGGDVGQNHEFLDQPMRIEAFGPSDADQLALGIEDQLALGQVEIERIAVVALLPQQGIGRPERPQHAFEQRRGHIVGRPSIARCACS